MNLAKRPVEDRRRVFSGPLFIGETDAATKGLGRKGPPRNEAARRARVRLADAVGFTETSVKSWRHLLSRLGHRPADAVAGHYHRPAARASGGLCPWESDLWDRDVVIDSAIFALEQMQLGSVITKRVCLEVA